MAADRGGRVGSPQPTAGLSGRPVRTIEDFASRAGPSSAGSARSARAQLSFSISSPHRTHFRYSIPASHRTPDYVCDGPSRPVQPAAVSSLFPYWRTASAREAPATVRNTRCNVNPTAVRKPRRRRAIRSRRSKRPARNSPSACSAAIACSPSPAASSSSAATASAGNSSPGCAPPRARARRWPRARISAAIPARPSADARSCAPAARSRRRPGSRRARRCAARASARRVAA